MIAVIGSSNPPQQELVELGEAVGRELAKRGVTVVCGGLSGVMEAVCRGAKSEGGQTIGILPGRVPTDANDYVDIPIVTTMGYSRNIIVVHTGAACIAVGGAFGTLCEISYALDARIPVVGLNTWEFTKTGEGTPIHDRVIRAEDPVDAVEKAIAAANSRISVGSNDQR
jgi:uncharacterized protein (TIGR00725 family)